MRPGVWCPPVEPSQAEQTVIKQGGRGGRGCAFAGPRPARGVSDGEWQPGRARLHPDNPRGRPPVPPAQLALATILQAYTQASDDEVIEATLMDRRWQLALDCLD